MSLELPEMPGERVEYRYVGGLPGVELFSADLSRHAFGPHTHDAFAIGAVVSGVQRFQYRGSKHVADRSALMFMNPDELHTGSAASTERWCYRFLHIEPATLSDLLGEGPSSPWFANALIHAPQEAEAMRRVIARLWQMPDALAAAGDLSTLLDAVCRRHARDLPATEAGISRRRFAPVLDHIEAHLDQPQSLDTLAALVGLSRFHFVRAFSRIFHVPPHRYLQARRLARARQLLLAGKSAADVAVAVGLYDQSHLNRWFLRLYGTTPSRYQQQVRPSRSTSKTLT